MITAPVILNDVRRGTHEIIVFDDGSDVGIPAAVLGAVGLEKLGSRAEDDGTLWLDSVSDVLRWSFDDDLALTIQAAAEIFPVHVVSLPEARPEGTRLGSSPTAYVNYALAGVGQSESVFLETGASRGATRFEANGFWNEYGGARRGLTRLIHERPESLDTFVAGDDLVLAGDPLGGSAVLAGLSWKRDFGIDPYFVTSPRVSFAGASTGPSTAEIYVNGSLTQSVPLPPGPFVLSDLPVPTGPGLATVIIRDPFGNTRTYENPYYYSAGLLAPGVSDFSYSVGAVRDSGSEGDGYGEVALVAHHRRGVTDRVTFGGRVELSEQRRNAGASAAYVWRSTEFESGMALSDSEHGSGWGAFASVYRRLRRAGLGLNVVARSDEYSTLSLSPEADRASGAVRAFAGTSFGLTSAILTISSERFRDQQNQRTVALNFARPVSARMSAFARISNFAYDGRDDYAASAGVSVSLGSRRSMSVQVSHDGGGLRSSVTAQQAQPLGEGMSYRIGATDMDSAEGSVSYDLPWMRFQLDGSTAESGSVTGSVAGGVVWIDGGVRLTQPISGAFGLAKVSDASDVRVYVGNQYAGRTDSRGRVFLPRLFPYYANKITIEDRDIPADYRVDRTEFHVAPPRLGAAILEFPVGRVTAFTGRIVVRDGDETVIPRFGEIVVRHDDQTMQSPVGGDGEFYFEGLTPGAYVAEVVWKAGRCRFSLAVPADLGAFGDVGTLSCTEVIE